MASSRRSSPVFWRRFFSMLANGVFDKKPAPVYGPPPLKSVFYCGNCTTGDHPCTSPRCPGYRG